MYQSLVFADIGREGVHITSLLVNGPSNGSVAIARHVGCPSNVGAGQLELMSNTVANDVGRSVGLRRWAKRDLE